MTEEDAVRKFAEEYIKALQKGDTKWYLKNADLKGMWERNTEQVGSGYTETAEEFEKSFKSNISLLGNKWNKKFTIKSINISGDIAEVEIDAEGAKSIGSPLILSKKSGSWKYIMGAVWFW
jgi:hypothetical protein